MKKQHSFKSIVKNLTSERRLLILTAFTSVKNHTSTKERERKRQRDFICRKLKICMLPPFFFLFLFQLFFPLSLLMFFSAVDQNNVQTLGKVLKHDLHVHQSIIYTLITPVAELLCVSPFFFFFFLIKKLKLRKFFKRATGDKFSKSVSQVGLTI